MLEHWLEDYLAKVTTTVRGCRHKVGAGEKSLGQVRGWVLHSTREMGTLFWCQRSLYPIRGRNFYQKFSTPYPEQFSHV